MEKSLCVKKALKGNASSLRRDDFTEHMRETIVLIKSIHDRSIAGHGVFISSSGVILTAGHIFNSVNDKVKVYWHKEGVCLKYGAKITKLERGCDLALLELNKNREKGEVFQYAKLAKEGDIGQDLHMIFSNDGGRNFEYVTGIVACIDRKPKEIVVQVDAGPYEGFLHSLGEGTKLIQGHNLHGTPGVSGSPVFDSRGRIIGIYSFGFGRMDFLIHFLTIKEVVTAADQLSGHAGSSHRRK